MPELPKFFSVAARRDTIGNDHPVGAEGSTGGGRDRSFRVLGFLRDCVDFCGDSQQISASLGINQTSPHDREKLSPPMARVPSDTGKLGFQRLPQRLFVVVRSGPTLCPSEQYSLSPISLAEKR